MADPRTFPGNVIIRGTLRVNGSITGIGPGVTITNVTLTGTNVINGTTTVSSGATFTTPTATFTTTGVTGTGATGGAGAVLPTVTPAFVTITGATGSGVDLPTGPIGATYFLNNVAAATMRIYCVGDTINGTTGTTAALITNTGNHAAWLYNTTASGVWFMAGNT